MPSEFCRFPVKIMAAYEALKKKNNNNKKNPLAPRASGKSIVVARTGPTASKRHAGQRAHSQCQGLAGISKYDVSRKHCFLQRTETRITCIKAPAYGGFKPDVPTTRKTCRVSHIQYTSCWHESSQLSH